MPGNAAKVIFAVACEPPQNQQPLSIANASTHHTDVNSDTPKSQQRNLPSGATTIPGCGTSRINDE